MGLRTCVYQAFLMDRVKGVFVVCQLFFAILIWMSDFGKADCYPVRMWYGGIIKKSFAFGVIPQVGEEETFRGLGFA